MAPKFAAFLPPARAALSQKKPSYTPLYLFAQPPQAATFVPYNEDLTVNYAGVDAHCRDLAVHGVPFAFSASG